MKSVKPKSKYKVRYEARKKRFGTFEEITTKVSGRLEAKRRAYPKPLMV